MSSIFGYEDYQRYNPFRTPDWRFNRIAALCNRMPAPGRCTHRDDIWIRQARNFLLRWQNLDQEAREQLFWEVPDLVYAYQIHCRAVTDDSETALCIEARLLADQDVETIADLVSTTPAAIQWYEKLFFNVQEHLHCRDWITRRVLVPAIMNDSYYRLSLKKAKIGTDTEVEIPLVGIGKPFFDGTLKMFGYFGGPYVIDPLLAGFQPGRTMKSPDDFSNWLDEQWTLSIKRRSTQSSLLFDVNKYNVMALFELHARLIEIERSGDAAARNKSEYEKMITSMLSALPLRVGKTVKDQAASEPRDDELVDPERRKSAAADAEIRQLRIPAPTVKATPV